MHQPDRSQKSGWCKLITASLQTCLFHSSGLGHERPERTHGWLLRPAAEWALHCAALGPARLGDVVESEIWSIYLK